METLNGLKRTHYCGDLRESNIGEEVVLMGWVQKKRNLGGLVFVDLRDRSGICQIIFDTDVNEEAFSKAEKLGSEYVIAIKGKVAERSSKNPNIPTGDIEVFATELKLLNKSETPPIYIKDDDNVSEELRLKYRYLDLRKPSMQKNLMLRSRVANIVRNYLSENNFFEIETPFLIKPTPEGARDYLVPSRVNEGKFYALPQSPQLFKQLLMVSGMDRYFQIVKCFRDEDLRADRQPEFTQIDCEMSFVEQEDVMSVMEKMVQRIFKEVLDVEVKLPLKKMTYAEAMERYGSDKPDTRFGYELTNISDLVANCGFGVFSNATKPGMSVRGINVKGKAEDFSKKQIGKLEDHAKTYKAKGLAWMKVGENREVTSPIAKFFTPEEITVILDRMDAQAGDLLLFVADKDSVVFDALGQVRLEVARRLDILDSNVYEMLWVTEFPLFEEDEETGRMIAKHHPFTSPLDEDLDRLEGDEKASLRAKAYDMVINGYEVGGGSVRIFNADVQQKMFKALGFTEEEANEKFGFLLEAFKYGTPPHAGMAFGLDRLIMILAGTTNIKDVIAFPKNQSAVCPMTNAPAIAEETQLEELSIKVDIKEEK
ncbi:aspartate--tRNA ligase [Paraclostridium sordellii]|uniref:aspartate--tRNA ligase n=1 Tax=Paraclostridium sordellii TaxID=1505 RepID=UPI0005EA05F3|nr:aspartate--tRNA ligase [Paeniclostridium sordellii]CEN90602.1 aspartyl-tRNA ligase [[Clostridium] sordellii] [Paeniclostridium sordellii]CEO30142.1 aspartyl-tRNA ligase [[Clostridium] sordellii] [Paeniclostridium sordellii]CEP91664.1 aspartyl-tRNA ligase [[Clostridium] sordellii] [Paeniclostridium sordellii]CEQ16085.1 aspartyl-tRNA ligase [[Clostridium] sordellii] [Paeniclostridium sordellii]CEQ24845.1 aspartyl-tRNA ligase [[Clostridium] sordellii] [Paeniclostridium sordellii]